MIKSSTNNYESQDRRYLKAADYKIIIISFLYFKCMSYDVFYPKPCTTVIPVPL